MRRPPPPPLHPTRSAPLHTEDCTGKKKRNRVVPMLWSNELTMLSKQVLVLFSVQCCDFVLEPASPLKQQQRAGSLRRKSTALL
jgi:hypothetical protein